MKKTLALMLLLFSFSSVSHAGTETKSLNGLNYQVYTPVSYDASKSYPLVLVLHHSTGRGVDMIERWKEMADKKGYVIVAPDSKEAAVWGIPEEAPHVLAVLDAVKNGYPIEAKRVYVMGFSAGATFAYYFALTEPDIFAAAAALGGRLDWVEEQTRARAGMKAAIPVLVLQGREDIMVSPDAADNAESTLKAAGYLVKKMVIGGLDHTYPSDVNWHAVKWFEKAQ